MNQRLFGLGGGGQTSHAFRLYWFLLSSNGFATKGDEGKSLLNTHQGDSYMPSIRVTWVTLGTFQTNSQPGAFPGHTDGHILQMFCKILYFLFKII